MVSCAFGKTRKMASAIKWAAEWRSTSSASAIALGEQLHLGAIGERAVQVHHVAVHLGGDGGLGESRSDRGGEVE